MNTFTLSEESQAFQELAKNFCQKEVAPYAQELDHKEEFPLSIFQKAWQLGLANVHISEEFGGFGLSLQDACLITEEIAAACPAVATLFTTNSLACAPLLVAGSQAQKSQYLSPLTASPSLAGYCLTSPAPIIFSKQAKASYKIFSGGTVVLNAEHASWYFLTAQDEDTNKLSAFVIDARLPGISIQERFPKLGLKCADLAIVKFDNVLTDQLIGKEGQGEAICSLANSLSIPLLASQSTGLCRLSLEHSTKYSKERVAFGQAISNFQAISFMLADMAKNYQAARLLTRQAAQLADKDKLSDSQAKMAFCFAADSAMNAALDAVQIFGAYGYSKEYPVEKLLRDAKMLQTIGQANFASKISLGDNLLGLSGTGKDGSLCKTKPG